MDELPTVSPGETANSSVSEDQAIIPPQDSRPKSKLPFNLKSKTTRLTLIGGLFLLLLIVFLLLVFALSGSSQKDKDNAQTSDHNTVKTSTQTAQPTTPYSQLQAAYKAIVGSDDVKKTLTLDASGVATIEYTITSTDGTKIIKTSYENFADFASRVFNIEGVTRLNVTTYATRFSDQFGQPDQAALQLQITKATSSKINWPLKKFSYKDYATILDYHQLNSLLQKDYEKLIKEK